MLFFYFLCATSVNQSVNLNRLEENGMNTDYKPMLSNGNVLTAKISASPSQETACTLSDILMNDVEEKYFLSPKQQEVLLFKPTAVTKENESTPPKD